MSATSPHRSVQRILRLLERTIGELDWEAHSARLALGDAASLLRERMGPEAETAAPDGSGRLLAWQARKVRDYMEAHIAGPLLVADLCALVQRSAGHFSRSFRRTFGHSPHAFLIRYRLERAAQYMVNTDAALSDIALRCGFTDQAHLSRRFSQAMGQTPSAWRRLRQASAIGVASGVRRP